MSHVDEGTGSGPVDAGAGPDVLANESAVPDADGSGGGDTTVGDAVTEPPKELPALAPVGPEDRQKWEYRCKICQLAIKYPTLYEKLHGLVLRDRRSYSSAMAEVNAYISQHRLQVHVLNMVNVLGHFKKHTGREQQVALALSRQQLVPLVPAAAAQAQHAVAPMVVQAVGDDVDDFNNLNNLRVNLTQVLTRLSNQLDVIDPQTNHVKLDKFALQSFVSLTSEARACIADLNKMRQSERLLNTVVQSLLEKLTFSIIPQLLEEFKVVAVEMRASGVPDAVVDRIDLRLRTKMAEIIGVTSRAAVMEVQRQFKLR